jgi:hypothetical protein
MAHAAPFERVRVISETINKEAKTRTNLICT